MHCHKISKFVREHLVILLISLVPYVSIPAVLNAQTLPNGVSFFTAPKALSRGSISPSFQSAEIWGHDYWCDYVKQSWGWSDCDGVDAFIVGYNNNIDTLLIETPNSEGYVTFDDWSNANVTDAVEQIEREIRASTQLQSTKLGIPVTFEGWGVYPTLDQENKLLYYSYDVKFGPDTSTNVKVSLFDRRGYVTFVIVPFSENSSPTQIRNYIRQVTDNYLPAPSQNYGSFQSGDVVAAAGAVGVLATMIGVKYSKPLAAGAMAILLLIAKKAWFLILLPIVWIRKLFKRNSEQ